MKQIIDIYWFSGTGNTLLAAKKMAEVFRKKGRTVRFFKIEKSAPSAVNTDHTLGLAFPVAAQSTYPLVWEFIDGLPPSDGTGIFMVDTLHVFSGGMVGPLRSILTRKGYRPLGAEEIPMPSNFYPGTINQEKNDEKIASGMRKAESFAEDLLAGTAVWRRLPVLSDLMYRISRSRLTVGYLRRRGSKFRADEKKCTRCGTCVKLCPVENISIEEGGYPKFSGRCQQCMRCISFCPTGAIIFPGGKYRLYRAVKAGELLKNP